MCLPAWYARVKGEDALVSSERCCPHHWGRVIEGGVGAGAAQGQKQCGDGSSTGAEGVGSRGREKRGQAHVIRSDGKANLKAG